MAKRGENIYKRKDGRYEGRYIKGRKEDGKPRFGYVYAYSYSEIKEALTLAKAAHRCESKSLVIGRGTLNEFLFYWLDNIVKSRVKPSTHARYYERINGHIAPAVGHLKIRKITEQQIQQFAENLSDKGLAASTKTGILGVLRSAMKKAKELGAIMVNPCENIKQPERIEKKARVLDCEQQKKLEEAAREAGKCTEIAVFLSLYTGLRIGELCALRWSDIDLETGTLTVRGTLQRIRNMNGSVKKTKLIEMTPKTKTSYRTIPLHKGIIELLKRYKPDNNDNEYVLGSQERIVEPRNLRSRFATLVRKVGLDINFHILRHTFATRCLECNFDIQTISELLGHSNAGITMQVYAHSVFAHKRQLVDRMQILS